MDKEKATIQLYCEKLENEVKDLKEDKEIIYNKIADLYDYIENRNYGEYVNSDFVLEELANIQQYAK